MKKILVNTIVVPERELYKNPEETFFIYGCKDLGNKEEIVKHPTYKNFTLKGAMPKLELGEEYKVTIEKTDDPKYGFNYTVAEIMYNTPANPDEEKTFLERSLTANQLNNLLTVYSIEGLLDKIVNGEIDFTKVKGVGEKTLEVIKKKINKNKGQFEAIAYFGKFECTPNQIDAILQYYDKNSLMAIEKTKENPYSLTYISGIGFKKVDPIARRMGIKANSKFRIQAGVNYILEQKESEGNTAIKKEDLFNETYELLGVKAQEILPVIVEFSEDNFNSKTKFLTVDNGTMVMLFNNFAAEKNITNKIKSELLVETEKLDIKIDDFIDEQEKEMNVKFTDEQKQLFDMVKEYRFGCLVGNAGTGKSFGTKAILNMCEKLNLSCLPLSPTGKASKVLTNYIGIQAFTIHKVLNREYVDHDVIIVDEASMVDVKLFDKLLGLLTNPNVRIYLVGDDFQLPSVGAGRLLFDLLETEFIPRVKLTKVFRQEEGGMLDMATKVRQGVTFIPESSQTAIKQGAKPLGETGAMYTRGDAYIIMDENVDNLCKYFGSMYTNAVQQNSISEVVTLTPRKNGSIGTNRLNRFSQHAVNGDVKKKQLVNDKEEIVYRVGDVVINTKNQYEVETLFGGLIDIFNGDMGIVTDVENLGDKDGNISERLIVDFEGNKVALDKGQLKNIQHSYAMTIHKSQGSSYRVVFAFIHSSHMYQLNANLLYTALTRGTNKIILLCDGKGINWSIKKKANNQRCTYLQQLLKRGGKIK